MAFTVPGPITGAPIAGLTTPTYTTLVDTPPASNGKQVYVSALGGTQTGVDIHTVSNPFTLSMFRPTKIAVLEPVNPATGQLQKVPTNRYTLIGRKGLLPLAGQARRPGWIRIEVNVPAGAETADAIGLAALHSMALGAFHAMAQEIYNTARTGSV